MQKRRFNLVDVVILLVILLAVAYVGKKILKPSTATATVPVALQVTSTPTPYYSNILGHLHTGTPVNCVLSGVPFQLGTVAATASAPDYVSAPNAEGHLTRQIDPISRLIVLTIDANATVSNGTYLFNGNPLYVGQYLQFNAGSGQVYGYITDIHRR